MAAEELNPLMETPEMEAMMKKMNYPIAKVRADPSPPLTGERLVVWESAPLEPL